MSAPISIQGVALFQTNRRQKRSFGSLEQEKIVASQIIELNLNSNNNGGTLPKVQGIQQILIGSNDQFLIALTKQGQIYIWGNFSVPIPLEDGCTNQNNYQNKDTFTKNLFFINNPQHVSYEGTIYAWGDDSEHKYGILGLGNQFKAIRPVPNSQLFDYMIKNVSLSDTHGCAVDSTGRLFCWGFGPNGELGLENQQSQMSIPTIVTKQKQIIIKKAIAHTGYTAFCSSAGYVYIYGSLIQSMAKIQSSQARFGFNSCTNSQRSSSQNNAIRQSRENPLRKSSNRPQNSMIQIISLTDNFISDLICGDSFIICLTSQGEVFFVDDALESVLISVHPIDDIAISSSNKILGISTKTQRLYQWSTAGLNKLSFNKENKVLLRQDFQIKEFQISEEFLSNLKLCHLTQSKNYTALIFDDKQSVIQQFKEITQSDQENEDKQGEESQLVIAKQVQNSIKQSRFNPLNESSFDSSKDAINEQDLLIQQQNFQTDQNLDTSIAEDSFQNDDITPEISIAVNEFAIKHESQPSFRQTEETIEENVQQKQPQPFVNDKEEDNILIQQQFQGESKFVENRKSVMHPNVTHRKSKALYTNLFQPIQNQNQFFDYVGNDQIINTNFAYRPSSIKSMKESNDNKSHSSYNNNSSPSLKQCADQMNPLGRTSKHLEDLSYPSFLNLSGENQNRNRDQIHQYNYASNSMGAYPLSPEVKSQQLPLILPQPLIKEETVSEEGDQSNKRANQEQKFEFKIKFQPCESMNLSQSQASSREASIISRTRQVDDQLEESMEITIDNLKIKTKRTTTPKRVLNIYSHNKRSQLQQTINENSQNIMNVTSNNKSHISVHSELSNGFNITQNSYLQQDNQDGRQSLVPTDKAFTEQNIQQQQNIQKSRHAKKLSNSCGSHVGNNKKKSFIHAVLQQKKVNNLQIDTKPTSVTQIYDIDPIEEETSIIKYQQDDKQMDQTEKLQNCPLMSSNESNAGQDPQAIANESAEGVYYIYGDQSSKNIQQKPPQNIQQRYSLPYENQVYFKNRESLGPVTQTDDNFEVEYSISNSCTPTSQSGTDIKRRINFDDASADCTNGVIRISEVLNNTKFLTSFSININKKQILDTTDNKKQIIVSKVSQPSLQNNQSDQSQSFIFNQCQSPAPQIQPFNEDNFVSNIKSATTPSNQGNTTHIMMLTEEKFKNLKTEISQQQDQPVNQFLITQNTLLSSPNMNDYNNFTKADTSKSLYLGQNSNIQNLSSFIKHSKYFQVYENFRRGFIIINKIKEQRRIYALRKIKRVAQDKKQKHEFLQNFAKYISNIMKQQIQNNKHFGFKRIKKFYKERQLQVYIQKKQNEFAIKTSALVKVDQILINHNLMSTTLAFNTIIDHFIQLKKAIQDKKKKSANQIFITLSRKSKQIQEKSLRSIQNWVNEKKLLEMNLKMLTRVMNKVILKQKRLYFNIIKSNLKAMDRQKQVLKNLIINNLYSVFSQFKLRTQQKSQRQDQCKVMIMMLNDQLMIKYRKNAFLLWKKKEQQILLIIRMVQIYEKFQNNQQKKQTFEGFKQSARRSRERQALLKINKASLLFLFKKLDDMKKQALKLGFSSLQTFYSTQEETIMINKSNTQTNLSFNMQNNGEMSLILNNKKVLQLDQNVYNGGLQGEFQTRDHYQTQRQPAAKSIGKQWAYGQSKKNYQTNQSMVDKNKKPTLNDYLSYTPNQGAGGSDSKQAALSKFFGRRKTEATCSSTKNTEQQKQLQKTYQDCPLPLKDYQEKVKSKQSQVETKISHENMNQLNVSIKDMNKAFRDQISRIREKQEENECSYMSSFQNITCQDQSYDNNLILQNIEISQTPDQLNQQNQSTDNYYQQMLKNISPKINPLCTSESYQVFKGIVQPQMFNVDLNNFNLRKQLTQDVQLTDKIDQFINNMENNIPQTSTFGALNLNDEDVEEANELKFNDINQSDQPPSSQRDKILERNPSDLFYGQTTNRRKSDQRYQRNSVIDYSLEIEQQHDMFDEFEKEEKEYGLQRKQSANNISQSYVKNSIADLSKKMDYTHYTQAEEVSQDLMYGQNFGQAQTISGNGNVAIQHAYKLFKQNQQQEKNQQFSKIQCISPKFNDESFVPSAFNRELLNEIAENYQMMELTPEADYQMLVNNKSVFNRQEESIYSNNQYADPIEMALSPRGPITDVSVINHQHNITTNQSNYYGIETQQENQDQDESDDNEEEYGDEISQIIEHGRDSRPYDFQLSSNSKYKIISENQQAKTILTSESAQPSMTGPNGSICKKLSFGYDMTKKGQVNIYQAKQKSTLILSGGEQTINFNLTQEEEEELEQSPEIKNQNHQSDEELDVGEEIPAENTNKLNLNFPESRILQQEQQEEKQSLTLSHQDLMMITANRMQKLQSQRDYNSSQGSRTGQTAADFISSNVQKLRNMIRISPTYETEQSDDQFHQNINSANQSTRNLHQRSNGTINTKNPQSLSYDMPQQYQKNRLSGNNQSQQAIFKSFVMANKTNTQTNEQAKLQYFGNSFQRNPSKENRGTGMAQGVRKNSTQNNIMVKQQSTASLREKPKSGYQPLTFRAQPNTNTHHSQNLFGNTMTQGINNGIGGGMMDRRISYQDQIENNMRAFNSTSGSQSQRTSQNSIGRSRNQQNEKLQTFLTMGNKFMTSATSSMKQSQNNSMQMKNN